MGGLLTMTNARTDIPDQPPDKCDWEGCDGAIKYRFRYSKPKEYVYYCKRHGEMYKGDDRVEAWRKL